MLEMVNKLINKFRININQIISNSDNTIEDIRNEAFIVVEDNYTKIVDNERVFINELKTRCLKFNKYGKRIESKERWELYNKRELDLSLITETTSNLDEDKICKIVDIKSTIGEQNYNFLIDYFTYPYSKLCKKYKLSEPTIRKKAKDLLDELKRRLT